LLELPASQTFNFLPSFFLKSLFLPNFFLKSLSL